MKNQFIVAMLATALFSCQQKKSDTEVQTTEDTISTTIPADQDVAAPTSTAQFDINKIPTTDKVTGAFPYVVLPSGYVFSDPNKYYGKGVVKDVDREYFYNDGYYFPVDGKTYKAVIRVDENFADKTFSKLEIQKNLDKFFSGIGGVKINNGKTLAKGEKDRLDTEAPNAYGDGYLHAAHNYDDVHTYVLRTKDQVALVQYNLGSESANITVMDMEAAQ